MVRGYALPNTSQVRGEEGIGGMLSKVAFGEMLRFSVSFQVWSC